jgi:hypothetical protein
VPTVRYSCFMMLQPITALAMGRALWPHIQVCHCKSKHAQPPHSTLLSCIMLKAPTSVACSHRFRRRSSRIQHSICKTCLSKLEFALAQLRHAVRNQWRGPSFCFRGTRGRHNRRLVAPFLDCLATHYFGKQGVCSARRRQL